MKTSEKTGELVKALLLSQQQFPVITKDKTAKVPTKSGGQYSYTYADLTSVLDAVKPILLKNGLVLQHGAEANGHNAINCRLSHISGEWQESALNLPDGVEAQSMGSAVTYYRRYTACAMLGISTEDDDDGAQATQAPRPQAAAAGPKSYALKPTQPKAAPKQDEQDPDRVPTSVTDGQAPAAEGEELEAVMLKAYSKPKTDKNGKEYRGVLLVAADNEEVWWNLYHAETIAALQGLKGKVVQAKLEDKNGYKLCHKLVEG